MQDVNQDNSEKQKPENKSPYQTPSLVEYGNVISLTRNSNMGSCPDAQARQLMQCNQK
jgi:hypothetical protein